MSATRTAGARRAPARTALVGLAVALLWLVVATPAGAHVRTTKGYAEVTRDGADVRAVVALEYGYLAGAAGLGPDAADAATDAARATALAGGRDALGAYLTDRIAVGVDGLYCAPTLQDTAVEERDGLPFARVTLRFDCPGAAVDAGATTLRYGVFSEEDAIVDDHTVVVDHDLAGVEDRSVLGSGDRELVVGPPSPLRAVARSASLAAGQLATGAGLALAVLLAGRRTDPLLTLAGLAVAAQAVGLAAVELSGVTAPRSPAVTGGVVSALLALAVVALAADALLGDRAAPHPRRAALAVVAVGLLAGIALADALPTAGAGAAWLTATAAAGAAAPAAAAGLAPVLGAAAGAALVTLALLAALVVTVRLVRRLRWSLPATPTPARPE